MLKVIVYAGGHACVCVRMVCVFECFSVGMLKVIVSRAMLVCVLEWVCVCV